MATSRALGWLESRKNLTGCACGLLGLVLTFTGLAGAFWPAVVAGLYGAGALLAPPERPGPPGFPSPSEQLDQVRTDLGKLRDYLTEVELPAAAGAGLRELTAVMADLLDPERGAPLLARDPEGTHVLFRAVRQDVPEAVDTYVRTRWWTRVAPGRQSPEEHLERQLSVLREEVRQVAAGLGESEARRQESHTRYLEGRGGSL
ncbi:hypothetical protein ACWC10_13215 [Streptomyces sp. NPDC001595]|uniref:hypothetical protein n=1 Tax=Streptomyces sp. NPDC001532 TaxID=3154520 RepID=UPI00332BF6E6